MCGGQGEGPAASPEISLSACGCASLDLEGSGLYATKNVKTLGIAYVPMCVSYFHVCGLPGPGPRRGRAGPATSARVLLVLLLPLLIRCFHLLKVNDV